MVPVQLVVAWGSADWWSEVAVQAPILEELGFGDELAFAAYVLPLTLPLISTS